MEDNTHRRKRDLRDVSHYFFTSKKESEQPLNNESNIKSDIAFEKQNMVSRSIIDEIKNAISNECEDSFHYTEIAKHLIDSEVNAFGVPEVIEPEIKSSIPPVVSQRIPLNQHVNPALQNSDFSVRDNSPCLKVMSLVPIESPNFSLLLNIYFAKYLLNAPYKICIVTANPHPSSWNFLERNLNLPSLVDIDLKKRVQTFRIFDAVDLIVIGPEMVGNFFNSRHTQIREDRMFDAHGKQQLFLIDYTGLNDQYLQMVSSVVDSFIVLSSAKNAALREAYKTIKSLSAFSSDVSFKCILNEKADAYLEEFMQREFNVITAQFLNRSVDFIGFCDTDFIGRGNNIKWNTKEKEHIFSCKNDFLASIKKEKWNEHVVSFYQTVISNVKS
jgi:hypothetical protein